MKRSPVLAALILTLCLAFGTVLAEPPCIKMATTTSTENSGLLDVLLPAFTSETGIEVKVLAKGTGAALRDGMDGNVDCVFVHDREKEAKFVEEGYGAYRLAVMHNDFVLVGPARDPAGVRGAGSAAEAFSRIVKGGGAFVSRGDDSGTHSKEQALWKKTGLPLEEVRTEILKNGQRTALAFVHPAGMGGRYLSIGQGMGKTLTFAAEKEVYALTDRGTFLKFKYGRSEGLALEILYAGDMTLANPYGIIPVNPARHSHVRFAEADRFAKWLTCVKAQNLIKDYKIHGQQAFFPDALPEE